jgi:hypothetical protein
MKGKNCMKCNIWFPLFMFKKDSRKFKLPTALGRVRNCKLCNWKDSKNTVVRWRDGQFILIKLTLKERLKELIK